MCGGGLGFELLSRGEGGGRGSGREGAGAARDLLRLEARSHEKGGRKKFELPEEAGEGGGSEKRDCVKYIAGEKRGGGETQRFPGISSSGRRLQARWWKEGGGRKRRGGGKEDRLSDL